MYIFTGHRWSSWSSLFVCLWAVSDIMVWLWCCVSLQHALRASGPVQRFYSGTKPVMHCHGHAHTPMRETRKDTFFFHQRRRLSSSSTQPNVGVSACFLCACRAVCFDLDALDSCWFFFILAIWSGNISHLVTANYLAGSRRNSRRLQKNCFWILLISKPKTAADDRNDKTVSKD